MADFEARQETITTTPEEDEGGPPFCFLVTSTYLPQDEYADALMRELKPQSATYLSETLFDEQGATEGPFPALIVRWQDDIDLGSHEWAQSIYDLTHPLAPQCVDEMRIPQVGGRSIYLCNDEDDRDEIMDRLHPYTTLMGTLEISASFERTAGRAGSQLN